MKITALKPTFGTLALAGLLLASNGALAYWDTPGYEHHAVERSRWFSEQIDARQDRQRERIRAGLHDGRLSRGEFRELMNEQHRIRAMERHFRADGLIDEREFRRLDLALDRAGRNIREEKHDDQGRYAYNASPWRE